VSKAADRSSRMRTEDLEASLRASITESRAVSVECLLLKPDGLLSKRLFCVRKEEIWLKTTLKCFRDKWKKRYRSVTF